MVAELLAKSSLLYLSRRYIIVSPDGHVIDAHISVAHRHLSLHVTSSLRTGTQTRNLIG